MMEKTDDKAAPAREAKAGKAPKAPEAPAPEMRTPAEWAEKLGHRVKARAHIPQSSDHYSWQHACADKLHGWSHHAYHFQATPFLLTQADYEAALVAAGEYPAKPAHESAIVPSKKPSTKEKA